MARTTIDPSLLKGSAKIVQIVMGTSTTSASGSSSSYTSTNSTASITPSKASSKILVLTSATIQAGLTGTTDIYSIFRDTTDLAATAQGFGQTTTTGDQSQLSLAYLDSPSTTSSVTYTIKGKIGGSAHSWTYGVSTGMQVMLLLEVAA